VTPSDLADALKPAAWAQNFSRNAFQRARTYAAQGRVRDLRVEPGDNDGIVLATLTARVAGSGSHIYRCQAGLEEDGGIVFVESRCTCPIGYLCKHAAAMLIAADSMQGVIPGTTRFASSEPDLRDWNHWLANLAPPPRTAMYPDRAEPHRCFGVLLAASQYESLLLAQPAWLRPSKRKGKSKSGAHWVDPQPVHMDMDYRVKPRPAEGWPDRIEPALANLANARRDFGRHSWSVITSEYQEQALETLVAHYDVWFERGSQPLRRGETLTPELRWEMAEDGMQRLRLHLPFADARILRGAGAWYVSIQAGQFGRIEGDPRLLAHIADAPRLTPDEAAQVRQAWKQPGKRAALPKPQDPGPPEIIDARPALVLTMDTIELDKGDGREKTIGAAQAALDYAGLRVRPMDDRPVLREWRNQHLREAHRDADAEDALMRMLSANKLSAVEELPMAVISTGLGQWHDDDLVLRRGRGQQPATPDEWRPVLQAMSDQGVIIEYEPNYPRAEPVQAEDWYGALEPAGNHWFEVSLGIEVAGEKIDLLPMLRRLVADPAFPRRPTKGEKPGATWRVPLDENRYVELPLERLRRLIEPLLEWLETEPDGEPRVHASQAAELDALPMAWRGGERLRQYLKEIGTAREPARAPRGFRATLRPYQRDGLAWLNFLGRTGLGGILADDMGLGKTVQMLAHIQTEKLAHRLDQPVLVVAPTSLIGNWAAEAARFTPGLKVLILHGPDRHDHFDALAEHDLTITTYPLLPRDGKKLAEHTFSLLVLDEAQAIKNARSQAAQAVRKLNATRRVAMTGTPLENHLGELWAQVDAVEPGLLGSERHFKRHYRTPIEKHADAERQRELNRRIGALILRRRKEDVLTDLPAKNEMVRTLELAGAQRELYETLRLAQHERVREAIKKRGLAQAGIVVLDALLKLRQACCDPRLVKLESARKVRASAKLEALLELIEGLIDEGRHVLVFSQFTSMLALISAALEKRKITFETLTGQTPAQQRSARVTRFQEGQTPVFLISLKAGGTGLNLTAADTVIHYDPWWNPAIEAQATDRAHRIGQDKPVFVYRLICAGTVEEKIQAMQAQKADLARAVLEGGASRKLRFDEQDLEALLGPS
jgi:superfamily II DNA or RNA helicase